MWLFVIRRNLFFWILNIWFRLILMIWVCWFLFVISFGKVLCCVWSSCNCLWLVLIVVLFMNVLIWCLNVNCIMVMWLCVIMWCLCWISRFVMIFVWLMVRLVVCWWWWLKSVMIVNCFCVLSIVWCWWLWMIVKKCGRCMGLLRRYIVCWILILFVWFVNMCRGVRILICCIEFGGGLWVVVFDLSY